MLHVNCVSKTQHVAHIVADSPPHVKAEETDISNVCMSALHVKLKRRVWLQKWLRSLKPSPVLARHTHALSLVYITSSDFFLFFFPWHSIVQLGWLYTRGSNKCVLTWQSFVDLWRPLSTSELSFYSHAVIVDHQLVKLIDWVCFPALI